MAARYRGAAARRLVSRAVLQPGDRVPDVTLFDNDVQPVRLVEFAAQGPLLLAFYLYDWTGT